jgi:hypothetical protein
LRIAAGEMQMAALERHGGQGLVALLLGLLVAGAVASSTRARGVILGRGYLVGVAAAVGGFWLLSLLGLGEDHALVQSALPPLVALAVGFGASKLRAPLAGAAAGAAGWLLLGMVTGPELRWLPSLFGFASVWLALNALICVGLAKIAIRR